MVECRGKLCWSLVQLGRWLWETESFWEYFQGVKNRVTRRENGELIGERIYGFCTGFVRSKSGKLFCRFTSELHSVRKWVGLWPGEGIVEVVSIGQEV